jgi:hypothetical protein
MPTAKPQGTAQAVGKTSLAKQPAPATGARGRLKAAERLGRGGPSMPRTLPKSAASAAVSGDGGNCPVRPDGRGGGNAPPFYVPVVSSAGKPLMPCHPARARELVRKGRAVRRFRKGFFYIQLLDRSWGQTQPVVCGIDPGSKREGFTVKDAKRTFLNLLADAVTHVREAVAARREMRRNRRYRKTPCRKPRANRRCGRIPPSTLARWSWKLRVARLLCSLYPIGLFVVEDIKAEPRTGQRRWNASFSPLQVGKEWFYGELRKLAQVTLVQGHETARMREELGLRKSSRKDEESFWSHCVDSWVLAASAVGGSVPEDTRIVRIAPLRFRRRSLHLRQPAKGGVRRRHGGTVSLELRRGTQVLHPRFGLCYVGGHMRGRLSLHAMRDGRRLTRDARVEDLTVLAPCSWRVWVPKRKRVTAAPSSPD